MKSRFLDVAGALLAATMNYLVVLCVWAVGNALAKIEDNFLLMLLFLLIPYFFYFIRLKVEGFFVFTIIHAAVPIIGIALCPDVPHKAVIGTVLGILSLVSYVVSMKSEEQDEPCIHPVLAGAVMFGAIMLIGVVDTERLIYIPKLALLFAALYLPYFYLEKFIWFEFINSKTVKNIPTEDSFKIGAPIVCGLSLFYALASMVGINEALMQKMSDGIRALLGKIMIRFLSSSAGPEGSIDLEAVLEQDETGNILSEVASDPSPLALFLEKVVLIAVMIILVVLIMAGLVVAAVSLVEKIKGRKRVRKVRVYDDAVETRESLERTNKFRPIEAIVQEGSYANRIRRMYRKIVKKNYELTDKPELVTARGFSELFTDALVREKALNFVRLYEKARYSADEVTKDDYLEARHYTSYLV